MRSAVLRWYWVVPKVLVRVREWPTGEACVTYVTSVGAVAGAVSAGAVLVVTGRTILCMRTNTFEHNINFENTFNPIHNLLTFGYKLIWNTFYAQNMNKQNIRKNTINPKVCPQRRADLNWTELKRIKDWMLCCAHTALQWESARVDCLCTDTTCADKHWV